MRLIQWSRGLVLAGMMVGLLASASFAQPPGGGRGGGVGGMRMMGGGRGGMLELLNMEEVRKELKLDEAQTKELGALRDEVQSKMEDIRPDFNFSPDMSDSDRQEMQKKMEEFGKKVAEITKGIETKAFDLMDPDQQGRLVGLLLQRGTGALANPNVAAALGLTADQTKALADIDQEAAAGMMRGARGGRGGGGGGGGGAPADFEAIRTAMQEAQKKTDEKRMGVLTEEQKTKMESLKGAKFEFPARGGPGGAGGGRGQGGGRPGGRPGGSGN